MGFIRFIGDIILIATLVFIIFNGYQVYKSKHYLSKKTLIIVLIAIVGTAVGSPLSNMQSKHEIMAAKEHSESIESKKDHSESIKESAALSKKIESSNSKLEKSPKEKKAKVEKANSDVAFLNALNELNTGFAESVSYDKSTDTVTWIGFDDWKNWDNDELQGVLEKIQVVTLRQAIKYKVYGPKIVVKLPDNSVIATKEIGSNYILH